MQNPLTNQLTDRLLNPTRRYFLGKAAGIGLGAIAINGLAARENGGRHRHATVGTASKAGDSTNAVGRTIANRIVRSQTESAQTRGN